MRKNALFTLTLASALSLVGCNSSPGLLVSGEIEVATTDARSGFVFEAPTRLDGADASARVTGSCTLRRHEGGHFGAVVDLYGPGATDGRALRSITLMTRTDAPTAGSVEATLGTRSFTGACTISTPLVDARGGLALHVEACELQSGDEAATLSADLTFENCVIEGD